jgi:hypothetical protein
MFQSKIIKINQTTCLNTSIKSTIVFHGSNRYVENEKSAT